MRYRGFWERAGIILCGLLLFFVFISGGAEAAGNRVLVLMSRDATWPSARPFMEGMREGLGDGAEAKYVFMDMWPGDPTSSMQRVLRDIWRGEDGRADCDAVCTVGDEALRFVIEHREGLFSGLPVIYAGINDRETIRGAMGDPMMTGEPAGIPIQETIALAWQINPKAKRVVGITDGSTVGAELAGEFMRKHRAFPELSFSLLDASQLTEGEIAEACRSIDRETILLFLTLGEDKTGKRLTFRQAIRLVADNAAVPVYCAEASGIGEGFLGGVVVPYHALGAATGEAFRRVFGLGEEAGVAGIQVNAEAVPLFDETLMADNDLARDMLPPTTRFVCELPGFWTRYRGVVIPVVLLFTALIIVLVGMWVDSRRHVALLRELKAEEQRLARLVENIPAGLGIYVFEDNVLKSAYLNQGYYDMLGVDKEKRMEERKEFLQFVHPDDLPAVLEEIQKDFMEERDFEGIFRLLDGSGKYRWINLRVRLVEKQGNRKTYYGAFHDNDSLMQAHQELHESQEMMRAAIEHSDLQAWVYDPNTGRGGAIVIDPTRKLEDYGKINYPSDAVTCGLVHPDDVEKFLSLHQRMKDGESVAEAVVRIRKTGVGFHWERVRYTRLKDVVGRDARVLGTAQDMDAYKELEQRFRTTITQTGISAGVYDVRSHRFSVTFRDQHIEFQNAPEEIIAKGYIHPDDEEKYRSYFRRMDAGESTVGGLVRFTSGGGASYRWYHYIMTAVPDRDGKPFRAMSSRLDVTEQVRREMRYREELMRRQSLEGDVVSALSVNITQNTVQEYVVGGENLHSAIGKSLEWAVAQELSHLPEEKDKQAFRDFSRVEQLTEAIRTGEYSRSIEYVRRFENGELRWARCRYDLMENPETGDWMLFAYVRDIHEAKVDEIAFSNVMEGMVDYITCIDVATGKARFVRPPGTDRALATLHLDDYFDFEASTLRATALLPDPAEQEEMVRVYTIENLVAALEKEPVFHFNCWVTEKGVPHRKEMRAFYLGSSKSLIINIQRDITDVYTEAEQKREELRKALDMAEKASRAKSDFLSRMSHEIRTPMNAIIGLTALAKGRVGDVDYVAENLSKMDSAAHFLLGLINDVLDISRIERGKMQLDNMPHDMTEFLEGIDIIIRARAADGGVRYRRTSRGDLPDACIFDALKLKQVLVNILSNAVKFTPRDGSVDFIAETLGTAGDWATLQFTIRDTGIGIDREFLPHIFDAFEQESAGNTTRYGGTGLGLAISKSIIDLMGGSIRVESEKGVGSIFFVSVTFPVTSLAKDIGADDAEEADFTGKRALLAEDNEINREIATAILEDKGFTVTPVTDGEEAVTRFREGGPGAYDVILMDIRMPFLDGFEATERIRALEGHSDGQTIPIVAMTANAFEEDIRHAREVGMNEYLTKPVEPDTVYKVLWKILRKKRK